MDDSIPMCHFAQEEIVKTLSILLFSVSLSLAACGGSSGSSNGGNTGLGVTIPSRLAVSPT